MSRLLHAITGTGSVILALTACAHSPGAPIDVNLVANPRFENPDKGVPAKWVLDNSVRQRGTLAVESGVVVLRPNAKNTDSERPFGLGQLIPAASLRGKKLEVRADLSADSPATAQFVVFALGAKGKAASSVVLRESDQTSLTPQSGLLDVPADASNLIVGLTVNGTSGAGRIGNIMVREHVESSKLAAPDTTPFAAGIQIDATKIVREIPRTLYGANVEWFRSANGLWDESSNQFDARLLSAAADLSLSLIRFPGGALTDYYHWRDGVGPAQARPVRPHVLDDDRSKNSFGTDELLAFCRRTGAEPLISVNVATGTAQEAEDWVAYCNPPNSGARVRFWEIGNEQYMKQEGKTAASGMSAARYADQVLEFSRKMRQASPGIRIIAVGGLNFGRYRFVANPDWDKVLLERAAGAIDYLSVHDAYAPVLINSESLSVEDAYRALFAFPAQVRQHLDALGAQIDRYAPRDNGRIRLAITEWGPLFHILPSSKWVDHDKTLGSGLFVASMMQAFLNSPRLDIADFFKLTEGSFMGWINGDGTPKPSYLALSLYTRHFGSRLVTTGVTSPAFDASPAGVVSGARNVPYVEAVSSLSSDARHLYFIAVNKHFTAPAIADVNIEGFKASGNGRKWVLTGDGLDSNNGPDLPNVPGLKWAAQAQAERDPHFNLGARDRIRVTEATIEQAGPKMRLMLPPLSATAVELDLSAAKGVQ